MPKKVKRKTARKKNSIYSSVKSHPVNTHPIFTIFFFLIAAGIFVAFIIFLQK